DLQIPWPLRFSQWKRMLRSSSHARPFKLQNGDITALPFVNNSIDIAYAVSVIEHGVDINRFFAEAQRVLKPGGLLFVTTDYWPDTVATGSVRPFDLSWRIFSRDEINALVDQAQAEGFGLHTS